MKKVPIKNLQTTTPIGGYRERFNALMELTTIQLKEMLRAAGLPIPKGKADMAERLAADDDVHVTRVHHLQVLGVRGRARKLR